MPENNECQPIVIFPLGVACQVTNPSGQNASKGTATLIVTGGTPPYNITWENGNSSFAINNLSAGSYPATIVDYYGDFTANTTCVLTGPVVPTTTTTTTTSPIITYDFCMVIHYFKGEDEVDLSIYFNPNGVVNGKESWISDDELYTLVWDNVDNRWELVDNITNLIVINNNPDYPPLSGWLILGKQGTVSVTEGECVNVGNLRLMVTKNDPSCTSCDASITIQGLGGVPPYQYSVNGGTTWVSNPLFNNLCPDVTFTPQIKDSEGTIVSSQSGNVIFISEPMLVYTISMNIVSTVQVSNTSYEYTYVVSITPPLPNDGTTIKFDMNFYGTFIQTPYLNSATKSYTTEIIKNGLTIPSVDNDVVTTVANTTPGCTNYLKYLTNFNRDYTDLTINSTDVYSIKLITDYLLTCNNPPPPIPALFEIQTPEPTPLPNDYNTDDLGDGVLGPLKYGATATGIGNSCCSANFVGNGAYTYSLTNPTITGCQCCSVTGFNYNTNS